MTTTPLFQTIDRLTRAHTSLLAKSIDLIKVYEKEGMMQKNLALMEIAKTQAQIDKLEEFGKKLAEINALIVEHNEKPCPYLYERINEASGQLINLFVL
jgi:hypothetical protein